MDLELVETKDGKIHTKIKLDKRKKFYKPYIYAALILYGGKLEKETSKYAYYTIYADMINREEVKT